jgi:uncharacterized protein (TIGR02996 family)
MNTPDLFLQEIISDTENDTPRLIYADWLEENNETARADFIRTQCALEQFDPYSPPRIELEDHASELLKKHQVIWQSDIPDWAHLTDSHDGNRFRRGFLNQVSGNPTKFLQTAGDLFAAAPVVEAHLGVIQDSGRALADCPFIARLRNLSLAFSESNPDLGVFLVSPNISRLRGLKVSYIQKHSSLPYSLSAPIFEDQDAKLIGACGNLSNLRSLDLNHQLIGPNGLSALIESSHLVLLESLSLANNPLANEGIRRLAESPRMERLTELNLWNTQMSEDCWRKLATSKPIRLKKLTIGDINGANAGMGFHAFAECESLAALRELTLHNCPLNPGQIRALAQSPHLANLQILILGGTGFNDAAAQNLADSPFLRSLRFLDLQHNRQGLGPAGLAALARSPILDSMTEMWFYDCFGVGDEGTVALAESEHLFELRKLCLVTTGLGPKGTKQLASSPNLPNLCDLDLQSNPIGDEGAKALCESPYLGRIRRLALYDCGITKMMVDALRQRFGNALAI